MQCNGVSHLGKDHTGPLLGLTWRSMPVPDLGPPSDQFAKGLKRRVETGR